jgi:hypothetical protein
MGEERVVNLFVVGKHEGQRSLGRPRRGWESNIKMDLQEVEWGCRLTKYGDSDRRTLYYVQYSWDHSYNYNRKIRT